MVTGFDRPDPGRRIPAQIVQEVRRIIRAYAFHDLGEHKPGFADRSIQVLARLARHGANFNRKFGGLFKFPRLFGQASGNATDSIALEASVKRGTAESRDRRL